MSNEKIYLNRAEQTYLLEMLEETDIFLAVDKFAELMILEKADPTELQMYLKKIMAKMENKK